MGAVIPIAAGPPLCVFLQRTGGNNISQSWGNLCSCQPWRGCPSTCGLNADHARRVSASNRQPARRLITMAFPPFGEFFQCQGWGALGGIMEADVGQQSRRRWRASQALSICVLICSVGVVWPTTTVPSHTVPAPSIPSDLIAPDFGHIWHPHYSDTGYDKTFITSSMSFPSCVCGSRCQQSNIHLFDGIGRLAMLEMFKRSGVAGDPVEYGGTHNKNWIAGRFPIREKHALAVLVGFSLDHTAW